MTARAHLTARLLTTCLILLGSAALLLALAPSASAHEHVTAGDLEFIVGWGTEPAILYQMNTITVEVQHNLEPSGSEVVSGVATNFTVSLSTGTVTAIKTVEEVPEEPGTYAFPIVPTREGTYTVTIVGQINGTQFNVSTDPEDVEAGLDVNFPVSDPTVKDLGDNATDQQAQIASLEAQLAALQGGSGAVTQAQLDDVSAQASQATLVAVVGVLAGVVGVGVGVVGMRRAAGAKPKP